MPTILVVDDDPSVRTVVERHLTLAGYRVVPADDGKTALVALRAGGIDLVIADMYMPGIDGLEFLARSTTQGRPPVIAMSGASNLEMSILDMARRLGAGATLQKPFSREQLLGTVRETLALPTVPRP